MYMHFAPRILIFSLLTASSLVVEVGWGKKKKFAGGGCIYTECFYSISQSKAG